MRTVRSAARARNRPRPRLAWLLLVGLGILLALAARAGASSGERALDPADPSEVDAAGDDADPDGRLPPLDALLRRALADPEPGDDAEPRDAGLRHPPPSRRWQLELALVWRRSEGDAASGPSRRDALWILAIWSR